MSLTKFKLLMVAGLLLGITGAAQAQTQLRATRVIYPAGDREVTIGVDNVGDRPRLVQAWVDSGDEASTPDGASNAFLVTPPLSRIEPGKGQSLRIMATEVDAPGDRESVYWLNVLEVPPSPANGTSEENYLQFAIRTRIKIFYRPKDLPGDPEQAMKALKWRLVQDSGKLFAECTNASAFNVSIARIRFKGTPEESLSATPPSGMCPAKSMARIEIPRDGADSGILSYEAINDYGGFSSLEASYTQ